MTKNQEKKPKQQSQNKPSNSGQALVKRDEHGRVLPGSQLNPLGPKPGYKLLSTQLREALMEFATNSDKTKGRLLIDRLVLNALSGKERSIEIILERLEGKVKDEFKGEIEHSGAMAQIELSGKDSKEIVKQWTDYFKKQLRKKNAERNSTTQ